MNSSDDFVGPVNMGSPSEFAIRELADMIIELTGSRSKIESKPLPSDDPKQRQPDLSLAWEKLNWVPKISVEEGLVRTISYFEDLLSEDKID
jgi:UDP-glucuronate decarboxylase